MAETHERSPVAVGITALGGCLFLAIVAVYLGPWGQSGPAGFTAGYGLGFICVLAAVVLWSSIAGRLRPVVEAHPSLLWLSYFPSAAVLIVAALNLLAGVSGAGGWGYHAGWVLALVVALAGLVPALQREDAAAEGS